MSDASMKPGSGSAVAAAAEMRADDALAHHHFRVLGFEQQAQAVRRLSAIGYSVNSISACTGLAVAQIRLVLTDRETP